MRCRINNAKIIGVKCRFWDTLCSRPQQPLERTSDQKRKSVHPKNLSHTLETLLTDNPQPVTFWSHLSQPKFDRPPTENVCPIRTPFFYGL